MENTENTVDYSNMVQVLAKPGADIIAALTPSRMHRLHMAIGIAGEGGELLDAVKKEAIYGKEIARMNVVEELGDLEFYMEGLRQEMGITREEVLAYNVNKLATRYKGKYSDQAAQARVDKQDGETASSGLTGAFDPLLPPISGGVDASIDLHLSETFHQEQSPDQPIAAEKPAETGGEALAG